MKQKIVGLLILLFVVCNFHHVQAAEPNWYWYYSSDYITQYCDLNSIKTVKDYNGNVDRIEAWIKTTYSDAGAQDTISAYKLVSTPNIYQLNYSLEKVYIKPKTRQIASRQEVFYSYDGNSLWSEDHKEYSLNWENIRPNSSNEREFSIIVDQVFNNGKLIEFEKWKTGNSRWVWLYSKQDSDGSIRDTWYDNMSIIQENGKIRFWICQVVKQDESTLEKSYDRWSYDVNSNTMELIMLSVWKDGSGWVINDRNVSGDVKSIIPESAAERWGSEIRKYVNENSNYVNRYSKKVNTYFE